MMNDINKYPLTTLIKEHADKTIPQNLWEGRIMRSTHSFQWDS